MFLHFKKLLSQKECQEIACFFFNQRLLKKQIYTEANTSDTFPEGRKNTEVYRTPSIRCRVPPLHLQKIIEKVQERVSSFIKEELLHTYLHIILYKKDSFLPKHNDSGAHEHTVDVCVAKNNPNTQWPFYICDPSESRTEEIFMNIGDGYHFKGTTCPHWRPPLEDEWQLQVFFHYVTKDGEYYSEALEEMAEHREGYYNLDIVLDP